MSTKKLALVLCVGAVVLLVTAGANAVIIMDSAIVPTVMVAGDYNLTPATPYDNWVMLSGDAKTTPGTSVFGIHSTANTTRGPLFTWTDGGPGVNTNAAAGSGSWRTENSLTVWADATVRTISVFVVTGGVAGGMELTVGSTGGALLTAPANPASNYISCGISDAFWTPGPYDLGQTQYVIERTAVWDAYSKETFSFHSDVAGGEWVTIGVGNAFYAGSDPVQDNYLLGAAVAPVPEPATMCLLVIGGIGALLKRRRNA